MLNQSDPEERCAGKTHCSGKTKKRLQNILLFTVMWLAKENMSVHRLILYLYCCRFQSQPSAFPQLHPSFLREQSWAWSDPGMPLSPVAAELSAVELSSHQHGEILLL